MFMNKLWVIVISLTMLALSSCSQLGMSSTECGSDDSKQLVISVIQDELNKKSLARLKDMLNEGVTGVDLSKVRALNQQITFSLDDVRTNHNDAQSKKKLCVAVLNAKLNPNMLNEANSSRAMIDENTIQDFALMTDIPFEQSKLSYNLEYSVQPTDDGKKIYAEVSNANVAVNFLQQVIEDVLLKPLRHNYQLEQVQANQQAEQEQAAAAEQAAAEQAAAAAQEAEAAAQYSSDQQAYAQLQIDEAKQNLDKSNEKLNLIWGAISKDLRAQLLDNQRAWLKKRQLECRLSSVDADNREMARLNCETRMTNQRTAQLQQAMENEQDI